MTSLRRQKIDLGKVSKDAFAGSVRAELDKLSSTSGRQDHHWTTDKLGKIA
ncbi:MAG: hypothetical protein ACRD3P_09115 [Terriglobales bacterium]